MKKSLFLEKIMDTAWLIKQSTSGYKLYRNINMLAMILHDYIVYEENLLITYYPHCVWSDHQCTERQEVVEDDR